MEADHAPGIFVWESEMFAGYSLQSIECSLTCQGRKSAPSSRKRSNMRAVLRRLMECISILLSCYLLLSLNSHGRTLPTSCSLYTPRMR